MSVVREEVTFLIVEDDEISVRAITRAFQKFGITNPIEVAHDGIEALELIRGVESKNLEWPYIVLLDINMPRMNGLEFLEELRSDPEYSDTVVFVLTTSDDDRDIVEAYKHYIAGYILKNNVGRDFVNLLSMLQNFTLSVCFQNKASKSAA